MAVSEKLNFRLTEIRYSYYPNGHCRIGLVNCYKIRVYLTYGELPLKSNHFPKTFLSVSTFCHVTTIDTPYRAQYLRY
jgi:hypothetical protein